MSWEPPLMQGGTKICAIIQGSNHFGISVPVPEGQSVYCSSALQYSYITVTYAVVDSIPAVSVNTTPAATTTAAPAASELCIAGATHSGAFSASYINGGYAKEVALEAGKVQYKRVGDALDDFGWVFWTTWGGGYWVVAHDNGSSSYSWAYQSNEDVSLPYDVSTWELASGASAAGWGGTLSVDYGTCTTTTSTTTSTSTTTTTAMP